MASIVKNQPGLPCRGFGLVVAVLVCGVSFLTGCVESSPEDRDLETIEQASKKKKGKDKDPRPDPPAPPGPTVSCERTIKADVVAIDQLYVYNRYGS